MEKQLKCVLLLSLKEIALRRVAVLLWNDSDILAPISKAYLFPTPDSINEWRKTVKDKVSKLELPELLTEQLIDTVEPIGIEIKIWRKNHKQFFPDPLGSPDSAKLCWTTAGKLNYRKTAEELLRCQKLNVKQRYEIACYYCLEEYISLYWEELPEKIKGMFTNDKNLSSGLSFFWPHILKGKQSELEYSFRNLISFNHYAFIYSVKEDNKTAAEYFFQKLTYEERVASVMEAVDTILRKSDCRKDRNFDLLFYLLSVMTPEQQMETIKAHPIDIFFCFLHWPLQDLFSENAGLFWSLLPTSSYTPMLEKIISRYKYKNFYFPKMFKEFFSESPRDLRKWFVYGESEYSGSPACRYLLAFFYAEDSESIKVMFRNMDAVDRVKFLFQPMVFELFYNFTLENRWRVVETCVTEATLSKEEKRRLKDDFRTYIEGGGEGKAVTRKFKRFFEFLDETDGISDNRKKGRKQTHGSFDHRKKGRKQTHRSSDNRKKGRKRKL